MKLAKVSRKTFFDNELGSMKMADNRLTRYGKMLGCVFAITAMGISNISFAAEERLINKYENFIRENKLGIRYELKKETAIPEGWVREVEGDTIHYTPPNVIMFSKDGVEPATTTGTATGKAQIVSDKKVGKRPHYVTTASSQYILELCSGYEFIIETFADKEMLQFRGANVRAGIDDAKTETFEIYHLPTKGDPSKFEDLLVRKNTNTIEHPIFVVNYIKEFSNAMKIKDSAGKKSPKPIDNTYADNKTSDTVTFDETGTQLLKTVSNTGISKKTAEYSDFTDFGGVSLPTHYKFTDLIDDEIPRESVEYFNIQYSVIDKDGFDREARRLFAIKPTNSDRNKRIEESTKRVKDLLREAQEKQKKSRQ